MRIDLDEVMASILPPITITIGGEDYPVREMQFCEVIKFESLSNATDAESISALRGLFARRIPPVIDQYASLINEWRNLQQDMAKRMAYSGDCDLLSAEVISLALPDLTLQELQKVSSLEVQVQRASVSLVLIQNSILMALAATGKKKIVMKEAVKIVAGQIQQQLVSSNSAE